MAFVSGYKHDLFLSYAHAEVAWVDAFRTAFCDEFEVRTGERVTLWRDSQDLRLGQKWTSEIEAAIRNAAAFLAIVSPVYLKSPWCREERRIALERKLEALKVESFYRFLKIIKTPGPGKAHEQLLGELMDQRFFNEADGYELPVGSPEFISMIRATVRNIRELLTLLRNKGQELYIAPGTIEVHKECAELESELRDRGFTVRPEILLDSAFGKGPIRTAMANASFAIFVLGSVYDEFTAEQIEVAQELGKPTIFWVQPGEAQNDVVGRLHQLGDLPVSSEVLGGRSVREMLPQLLQKIRVWLL